MKRLPISPAAILLGCLASGCQSDNTTPAAGPTEPSAKAAATTSSAQAGIPAPLPPSAINVLAGVEQQTPKQGYLQVVSAKALKVEPMQVTLPWMWGSDPDRPGGRKVGTAPGYRISYEAVLRWKPTSYGPKDKIPASLPLYSPNGTDSLASFQVGAEGLSKPERFTVSQIRPNTPVTVRGTLYAYTGQNNQKQPALVVFPYRDPSGLPEPNRMTFLTLHSAGQ
ncbi:hypothetical protein [Hymenobacter seoulensis]